VAIGRPVDAVPPVRQEGNTTVFSVVEEVVVVERRLVLKEEIRLRRMQTTERHRESVTLREQDAVIERTVRDGRSAKKTRTVKDMGEQAALETLYIFLTKNADGEALLLFEDSDIRRRRAVVDDRVILR
jgi:hypothetical protein